MAIRPFAVVVVLLGGAAAVGQESRSGSPPPTTAPASARPTIAEIRMLRASGDTHEAVARLEQLTASAPDRGEVWYELGSALLETGRLERAAAALARASEFARFRATAGYQLARAQARLGRVDAAFAALEQAMDAGFRDLRRLDAEPDLEALRVDESFEAVKAGVRARRVARDVLGTWAMETVFQGQPIAATMTLDVRRGSLGGTWASMGREMLLESVAYEGGTLRFVRRVAEAKLEFEGTVNGDAIEGRYTGDYGELATAGQRTERGARHRLGPRHDRPIIERDGRTLLWARGEGDDVEWFDMTDALVDPTEFQFGLGKDRIPSIDDPVFARPGDPRLAEAGIDDDTIVIGYATRGVAKAYPVHVLDRHEIVNDEFGGVPFAVCW